MRNTLATLAVLFTIGSTVAAHASTFDYTISSPDVSGTMSITVGGLDPDQVNALGGYTILDVTGTLNGEAITFDPTTGATYDSQDFFGYDDVLYPDGPTPFDNFGLALTLDGNVGGGIFFQNGSQFLYDPNTNLFEGVTISSLSSPSPAPEPGGLVLLGTGMLGVAGAVRRRFTKQ